MTNTAVNTAQLAQELETRGFCVARGYLGAAELALLSEQAEAELARRVEPIEYEADVGYPGAPVSRSAPGGGTPRRLLRACDRTADFRAFATSARLGELLLATAPWLGPRPQLAQGHHNCVMTKHPGFSSATHWHRDVRYWAFERPRLVSAWLALTPEGAANGALSIIPGSHAAEIAESRFDPALFLRPEDAQNRALIESAVALELAPGDLLLFDAQVLHAAGRNDSERTKLSAVFTYHAIDNRPLPGSRSAALPSLPVATGGC
ncbi:MAG: phytanoyl-CoA dioxygenase family protein [Pseudomonadota bacterium]